MNILDFERIMPPSFLAMLQLMIDGAAVAADHPRHGRCAWGEISAIVIRPGEKNRFDLQVSVQVKENLKSCLHNVHPKDIRVEGQHDRAGE